VFVGRGWPHGGLGVGCENCIRYYAVEYIRLSDTLIFVLRVQEEGDRKKDFEPFSFQGQIDIKVCVSTYTTLMYNIHMQHTHTLELKSKFACVFAREIERDGEGRRKSERTHKSECVRECVCLCVCVLFHYSRIMKTG